MIASFRADRNSDVGYVENAGTKSAESNVQEVYDLSVKQAIDRIGEAAGHE